jgi:quercetin dioxygenase-like cupin family protein
MSAELLQLLPEYVLGLLPEAQMNELGAIVAGSAEARREVDRLTEALAARAEALPPVEPSSALRKRLLDSVCSVDRFAPFLADLARLFDLSLEAIRRVLSRIDDATSWEQGLPGMELQHFQAGPRHATADAGLVRLRPGVTFPRHKHLGPEITFVLEGAMRDGDRIYGPGAFVELAVDSVHDYGALNERDLVIAVVHHGIVPVSGDS